MLLSFFIKYLIHKGVFDPDKLEYEFGNKTRLSKSTELIDLVKTIQLFQHAGIRVSIFVDPIIEMVAAAATTGTDRIELYTEAYATQFANGQASSAIAPYIAAAAKAKELGMGINAGHDLDLENLHYFKTNIPYLDEVSIGHALVCDALYLGYENTVQLYQRQLK